MHSTAMFAAKTKGSIAQTLLNQQQMEDLAATSSHPLLGGS